MRVFLDANILFSAAKPAGAIRQLIDMLCRSDHDCWADEHVVAEAHRNLLLKHPTRLGEFRSVLEQIHLAKARAELPSFPADVELADKDRPVLAAAIALSCDALMTGDQAHFGALYGRTVAGVKIYSPRQLAAELVG